MTQHYDVTIPQAVQMAQKAIAAGDFVQGEQILRQILAAVPNQPQASHMLGRIAMQAQRPDVALPLLQTASAALPDDPIAFLDFGNANLMLGRLEDAAAAYRRCLQLRPNHAGAWSNLGIALHEGGNSSDAIEAFTKARDIEPAVADRYNNLGTVLSSLGQYHEAIAAYQKGLELDPAHGPTRHNLANAYKESGRIAESVDLSSKNLAIAPENWIVHGNHLVFLGYDTRSSAEEIFAEHRRWNDRHARPLAATIRPHANIRDPQKRLKIGYLSPDFRDHSVSYFFEGLITAHDPSQVEIQCYADSQRKKDAIADRIRAAAHHWTNITGLSDEQVAEQVRKDGIDILIDLAGHTSSGRLLVFARRPAPVQISYLGYPCTTGLDAMDYYLTDGFLDPPGLTEHLFSERLLRLPRTFAVYRPPDDAPPVAASPARSNSYITFGSFNIFPKINEQVISTWDNLLMRVPDSRLLMKCKGVQSADLANSLRRRFAARGIAPDRLQFAGYGDRADYFAAHHQIDILLDPFPINGHTITCHALWMGVPVVSLAGNRHCGRLGASVLNNLGLTELLANSTEEYVAIAAELAGDVDRLDSLRQSMRARIQQSPIMDFPSFARDVEGAYRGVWREWCESGK